MRGEKLELQLLEIAQREVILGSYEPQLNLLSKKKNYVGFIIVMEGS